MTEYEIGAASDFVDAVPSRVQVGDLEVAVVRLGDQIYAVGDRCSHARASLSQGEVIAGERSIECPRHGATFDLVTGNALSLPATTGVPSYSVNERDGVVHIVVADGNEDAS